ncbi:hypothetical protein [Domibacillus robiginosus]|uniref:hypothetical protein n=1 Tax=Domibacillus robiginosus TaxID=1071054 RepID=UPI00067CC0D6|nr:hypothetical protein [Domibacillus robiginosus]
MSKRGTGVAFIMIAAFLIASKYLAAAIYDAGGPSWDAQIFNSMLIYVGNTLSNFGLLSLFVGIAYIVWEEYDDLKSRNKKKSNF